jgi:hypothetical protein
MMEAARTSETLVNFYQTTRCYNPEDSHLCNSLMSDIIAAIKPLSWLLRPVVKIFELALPFYAGQKIPKAHDMAVEVKNKYFNNSRPLLLQYIDVSVKA